MLVELDQLLLQKLVEYQNYFFDYSKNLNECLSDYMRLFKYTASITCKLIFGMGQTLVLNASYEPLNITSWRRAVILMIKGKAESL